jgi:hypothetical protein
MMQLMSIGIIGVIVLWLFSKLIRNVLCSSLLDTFGKQSTPIIFAMIAVISVWAVINTNGKTYLLFSVCIVFGIVVFSLNQKHLEQKMVYEKGNSILFQLLAIYFVFYLVQLFKVVDFSNLTLRAFHDDVAYSAGISDFLVKYHKETLILDPNSIYSWQPYHYFEMHFSALLSALTGFTSLKVLYLIVYPMFYAISVVTIKEFLNIIDIKVGLGLLLFIYVTNGDWGNALNSVFNIDIFPDVSNINKIGTKLAIYPVIIIGLVNFINNLRESSLVSYVSVLKGLFLGLICSLYPTSIPVVLFLIAFTCGYLRLGKFYWKIVGIVTLILLFLIFGNSEKLMDMVFVTHPIQHILAYLPILIFLFIAHYKTGAPRIIHLKMVLNFKIILIGSWLFLILLRIFGVFQIYNNPDSAQIYGNFFYVFVLLFVLIICLNIIEKTFVFKSIAVTGILSLLVVGFVTNQSEVFCYYFPMEHKSISSKINIPDDKLLVWDRSIEDFDINTSNWLIHFVVPYSNTRWEHCNYFPLLKTLPKANQIKKITQKYAFDAVIKKASNYNKDYFDSTNSVMIEDLIKTKTEQN